MKRFELQNPFAVANFIDNIEYWEDKYNLHKEVARRIDDSIN